MTTALAEHLQAQAAHERRRATRALLARPLIHADRDPDTHRLVRRHADALSRFFTRECGWTLTVDATHARLRKVPPTLDDATRAARARSSDAPFSRRRYVLLCLALSVLETGERQIALGRLADWIVGAVAAAPALAEAGVAFDLDSRDQRRDLVAVARLLIRLGILRHVHGDDQAYVAGEGDALYTVDRPVLASMLAARRPPSTITEQDLDGRLAALTHEPVPATPEARNRAIRIHLVRRLVDDAVLYYDDLEEDELAYLHSQRPRILPALEEATGLVAEVRAEGIALVDDTGDCTDVEMPDQGTDGHLTLLVAEHLAGCLRQRPGRPVPVAPLEAHVADLIAEHHPHWRRDVTDPGVPERLSAETVDRLAALRLARRTEGGVLPLPAIARYAVEEPQLPDPAPTLTGAGDG